MFAFLLTLMLFSSSKTFAAEQQHFTVIINQTRGDECCDPGTVDAFEAQLKKLKDLDLSSHFSLRIDVLENQEYLNLVEEYSEFQYGALLEVTPDLAKRAGVIYKGSASQWYEAQNIFLIGYSQTDRKKLIDTYMSEFKKNLGYYPLFSASWMIDSWSLSYLKKQYGVLVHQITREQFGTDSYTLYGGPMHYPYWPSDKWALVPEQGNFSQPLIVRQTIMDPVFNYGDRSSSYTSQPNDYAFRHVSLDYFKHLLQQAHNQPGSYTFALIGLENSMGSESQAEFLRQLEVVKEWQSDSNRVESAINFEAWLGSNSGNGVQIYGGGSSENPSEQAWWITTPKYRARLRLTQGKLALTDLRLYSSEFEGPYLKNESKKLGWWIVPFALDGSRFDTKNQDSLVVHNDSLTNRLEELGEPVAIWFNFNLENVDVSLENDSAVFTDKNKEIAVFASDSFRLLEPLEIPNQEKNGPLKNLKWTNKNKNVLWGFNQKKIGEYSQFIPFINTLNLEKVREEFPEFLFPEVTLKPLDSEKSSVYINNDHAIAGRNPVRLVFFPKDSSGLPVLLGEYPKVSSSPKVTNIAVHEQHGSNGMQFIDFENSDALKATVNISSGNFSKNIKIYFAPHCPTKVFQCLTHPNQAWWYVRSLIGDKLRFLEEKRQSETLYNQ